MKLSHLVFGLLGIIGCSGGGPTASSNTPGIEDLRVASTRFGEVLVDPRCTMEQQSKFVDGVSELSARYPSGYGWSPVGEADRHLLEGGVAPWDFDINRGLVYSCLTGDPTVVNNTGKSYYERTSQWGLPVIRSTYVWPEGTGIGYLVTRHMAYEGVGPPDLDPELVHGYRDLFGRECGIYPTPIAQGIGWQDPESCGSVP